KQKKLIMLPSETMIWQPEFTDKTLSRNPGRFSQHSKTRCASFLIIPAHSRRRNSPSGYGHG
ncbi:hypothetical protein N4I25_RS26685, partial [Escherichia coli]